MKKILAVLLSLTLLCAAFGAFAESAPEAAENAAEAVNTPGAENAPLFATVAEAKEKGEPSGFASISGEVYVTVVLYGDRWIRVVASMDEEAYSRFNALFDTEDYENLTALQDALLAERPVLYTEDLTGAALTREELDALTGRTIAELEAEGFEISGSGITEDDSGAAVVFEMVRGLFEYVLVMNEPAEVYEEMAETDSFGSLTVRSAKLGSVSFNGTDLAWRADGTYEAPEPQEEPFSFLRGLAGLFSGDGEESENGKDRVGEFFRDLGGKLSQAGETGKEKLGELTKEVGSALSQAGEAGKEKLGALLKEVESALSQAGETSKEKLGELITQLQEAASQAGENVREKLLQLLQLLQDMLSKEEGSNSAPAAFSET